MKLAVAAAGTLTALWIAGIALTAHALHNAPEGVWWTGEDAEGNA